MHFKQQQSSTFLPPVSPMLSCFFLARSDWWRFVVSQIFAIWLTGVSLEIVEFSINDFSMVGQYQRRWLWWFSFQHSVHARCVKSCVWRKERLRCLQHISTAPRAVLVRALRFWLMLLLWYWYTAAQQWPKNWGQGYGQMWVKSWPVRFWNGGRSSCSR